MRILILANIDVGLFKFRKELLESLVKKHEVFFCVPTGEFVEKIKKTGCIFIPCSVMARRSTNPIKDLKLLRFYQTILNDVNPDLVLTYTIKPNVYGGIACRQRGTPYFANVTGLGTSIENGGLLSKIATTLYKTGLKSARCVFFQNENNRKYFIDHGLVKGKSRLIPGSGVNLKNFSFKFYPTEKEGIRFLFVGRVMKDKGIEELLQAIQLLHNEKISFLFDVVGPCEENYLSMLTKAEQQRLIRYYGEQSDVHQFYENCHCVVLPSYHEGTSNVLLEASATGRPVIASRIPGCQETFDEGITGFGCKVRNAASLAEAMKRFLTVSQKQREQMGKAARMKMEKEYDRRFVIEAYKEEIAGAFR